MLTPCAGSLCPSKADALKQQHLCCLCPWQVLAGNWGRHWLCLPPPFSQCQVCKDSQESCPDSERCLPCLPGPLLLGLLCLRQQQPAAGHPDACHHTQPTSRTWTARSSSVTPILPNPQQLCKNYYFCLFFGLNRCSQSLLCAHTVILPL